MKAKSSDYWHAKYEAAGFQALLFLVLALADLSWSAVALLWEAYWAAVGLCILAVVLACFMVRAARNASRCYDRFLAAGYSTIIQRAE